MNFKMSNVGIEGRRPESKGVKGVGTPLLDAKLLVKTKLEIMETSLNSKCTSRCTFVPPIQNLCTTQFKVEKSLPKELSFPFVSPENINRIEFCWHAFEFLWHKLSTSRQIRVRESESNRIATYVEKADKKRFSFFLRAQKSKSTPFIKSKGKN